MCVRVCALHASVGVVLVGRAARSTAKEPEEKEKTFESGLKVGDKIITKSGIHGKIAEMNEDTIVVETMAGKIKMEKSAISSELSAKLAAK